MAVKKTQITYVMRGLTLLLFALAGYFIVRTVFLLYAPDVAWAPLPEIAPAQHQNTAANALPLGRFDPFHRDSAQAPITAAETAPETTLNLTLIGRRFGEDPTAIIRTPDGRQSLFRAGDEIMSGVTLEAVFADYVLIRQGAATEKLSMKREESMLRIPPEDEPVPFSEAPTMTASEFFAGRNADYVAQAEALGFSFNEVRAGNRRQGYRISGSNPALDLTRYGLQQDDIITRINDEDLTIGRPDFSSILAEALQSGTLTLQINRDGRTQTLRIAL